MTDARKLWPVFSTIENRRDALQTIKNASLFFNVLLGAYVAAFIQAEHLISTGHNVPSGSLVIMFADITIYAVGSVLLRRSYSRTLAIVLFCVSILNIVSMAIAILNGQSAARITVTKLIELIVLWGSVRAVEATFKLHGRFAAKTLP